MPDMQTESLHTYTMYAVVLIRCRLSWPMGMQEAIKGEHRRICGGVKAKDHQAARRTPCKVQKLGMSVTVVVLIHYIPGAVKARGYLDCRAL